MGKEEYQGPVELKDNDSENEELADSKNAEVRNDKDVNFMPSNLLAYM